MRILFYLSFISVGNAQLLKWPLFPFFQCGIRFFLLDFDVSNSDDYDKYFNDDSVMQLAQAGSYQGADSIKEYVKYLGADASPVFDIQKILEVENVWLGYDRENDQCQFLAKYYTQGRLNSSATGSDFEYHNVVFIKLYFSFFERKISRLNVFYYENFLDKLFHESVSDVSRDAICETANSVCSGIINPISNCTDELADLEVLTEGYFDGNSQGCRLLHSVMAQENPEVHCAHIAINATVDPFGKIKCQQSSFTPTSDLFTDEEFKLFDEFANLYDIDPAIGYIEIN